MIIVIFLVCVGILALGGWLAWCDCDITGGIAVACGIIGGIISFIAMIVLLIEVSYLATIDQRIEMYQEENNRIETQIAECVTQYQQYESGIFVETAPDSAITLVALYPELKADQLVSKQIEVYIENNNKIKELKEQSINGDVTRWWAYFGRSNEAKSQ